MGMRSLSRRCFLRATTGSVASGLVGLGADLAIPRAGFAETTLSPEAAIKELMFTALIIRCCISGSCGVAGLLIHENVLYLAKLAL